MARQVYTRHLAARFFAGAAFLAVLLAGAAIYMRFCPLKGGRLAGQAGSYVTNRQMQLASPWKGLDESALYQCMLKARNRQGITAAFIGGSITKGKLSVGAMDGQVKKKLTYVGYFAQWWHKQFPDAPLTVVNAGISATGSYLGVHRIQEDVLDKKPDLVVVEFAVNDKNTGLYKKSYENLVRKALDSSSRSAVMLFFMSRVNGKNCQEQQAEVGEYYHLPMASYWNVASSMLKAGIYTAKDLSGDGIHPSALGSAIAGEILTRYLEGIYRSPATHAAKKGRPSRYLTSEGFQGAKVVPCKSLSVRSFGTFHPANKSRAFRGNLECTEGNGGLEFTVNCKNLGFLYARQNDGCGGQFEVFVDGKKESEINADNYGARNSFPGEAPCLFSMEKGRHTVYIRKKAGSKGSGLILYALLVSG